MIWLSCLLSALQLASAVQIDLPINAQVPPVLHPDTPFTFTFSNSTFTADTAINYTLSASPDWLHLDGPSRTLSGTPSAADSSPVNFMIVATDNSGAAASLSVTLVISSDSGPQNGLDIANQLPTYGSTSGLDRIIFAPSASLSISFSRETFSNVNEDTVYYATSLDHTPLPSWIHFDAPSLTFSGTAPLALSKQDTTRTYGIALSASNVVGFADATAMFQISIELHPFYFEISTLFINATAGSSINDSSVATNLRLDGQPTDPRNVQVTASPPPWLDFDPSTLQLSGIVPPDFNGTQNFTVNATDQWGDTATVVVVLQANRMNATALLEPITGVSISQGMQFTYDLASKIILPGTLLNVNLGVAASWLRYDDLNKVISGSAPKDLAPHQTIMINLTASMGLQSNSQILAISVLSAPIMTSTPAFAPQPTTTNRHGSGKPLFSNASNSRKGSKSWIAAIVIPLALIGLLLLLLVYKRGCHRSRGYIGSSMDSTKQIISRPITRESFDEEKSAVRYMSPRYSRPPQIPDILPFATSRDKRPASSLVSKRPSFLQSFSSGFFLPSRSISFSRSESKVLQEESETKEPVRSFHKFSQKQNQKYSKISKHHQDLYSFSLGTQAAKSVRGFGHGKPDPSRDELATTHLALGLRSSHGIFGQGPPGFGTVRRSWRYFNKNASHSSDEWHTTSGSSNQEKKAPKPRNTIRPVTSTSTSSWQLEVPKPTRNRSTHHRMLSSASNRRQQYRHTRSRSSSLRPPVRPDSSTLRFPRVINVFSGRPHYSRRSSLVSTDSRFQSVAPSELGSIEFEYQNDMDRLEVRPGLSIAEHRRSSPLTDLANTFRRGEPATDDRSTLLGDDERTLDSAEGEPYDVRLMARGVRLGRQIGHGQSDPTQRSLRGRIETIESLSTGEAESKRSASISYV